MKSSDESSKRDQYRAQKPNKRVSWQPFTPTEVSDDNPFNNPLHLKIQAEFAAIKANVQAGATVTDACMHIIEKSGWGTLQEVAMQRATAADFEAAIRDMADLDNLRRFMRRMIEMRLQSGASNPHFGSAPERFIEACRNIANDANSPRLAGLIKRLFESTALASELASEDISKAPLGSDSAGA